MVMSLKDNNFDKRLRWSIGLPEPRIDVAVSPDDLAKSALRVEEAGFDGIWVSDHPLPLDLSFPMLEGSKANPKMGGGHQAWDPFVSLAWLAQVTKNIMLQTNAVVLPYRNPFLVAKAAATLQHLSGGRLIMSVAAGYLEAEFNALGVDMKDRTELMEEGIEALQVAWRGKPFHMSSKKWVVDGNAALPAPDPVPPLWRGGNSREAIAHAARSFDAWTPFEVTGENAKATRTPPLEPKNGLIERIELFRKLCAEAGRSQPLDICFVRSNWDRWINRSKQEVRDELDELREAGVTWIAVTTLTSESEEFSRRIELIHNIIS
jgi:probable F420-dependent oxidoreductase